MSDWPRITIVTPTFNRTEFLEETILSVLNQNYPNLEYIIVDGGSTEPALFELIRKYEHRLAWWISEKDRGHADAIRKGFDRSDGEIMNWLCSDDTFLPGCFHAVAQAFRENPSADVVFGHYNGTDQNGRITSNNRVVRFHHLHPMSVSGFHQASVFWKRSLYNRAGGNVGGPNMEYAVYSPDCDLFMRFANTSRNWVRVNKVLSTFRRHVEQTTTRELESCIALADRALRTHAPFWANRPRLYKALCAYMRLRRWILMPLQGDAKYLYYKLRGSVVTTSEEN